MKKILALCILLTAACGNKADPSKDQPAASASTALSAAPVASASAAPSASAASPSAGAAWSGTYTLVAGTLSLPTENKDYAGVKQFKDDPSKFMGDGKIDLTVGADGKVAGTIEGAAGPATIDGAVVEGELRGQVRRKDPKDDGLTGTLSAKIAGDSAEGKLSLADAMTQIIREGKVTLKKK